MGDVIDVSDLFEADEIVACPNCGSIHWQIWASGELWCGECPTRLISEVDWRDEAQPANDE